MSLYSVALIDRRTGQPHRINGRPLALFTKNPDSAEAELLRNRDTRHWQVRVTTLKG